MNKIRICFGSKSEASLFFLLSTFTIFAAKKNGIKMKDNESNRQETAPEADTDNRFRPLRELIERKDISPRTLALIQNELPDLIAEAPQTAICPDTVLVSTDGKSIRLSGTDRGDSVRCYGLLLQEVLAALPAEIPFLRDIAIRCSGGSIRDAGELRAAIERGSEKSVYKAIIILIILLSLLLFLLNL